MANARGLQLNPIEVAKTLRSLDGWRPTGEADGRRMREDALRALYAMDRLSELDLPDAVDLDAGQSTDTVDLHQEAFFGLLDTAEKALGGSACRQRIQGLSGRSPSHAAALEHSRERALVRVRRVRQKLAFIRDELDALEEPAFIRRRVQDDRTMQ